MFLFLVEGHFGLGCSKVDKALLNYISQDFTASRRRIKVGSLINSAHKEIRVGFAVYYLNPLVFFL